MWILYVDLVKIQSRQSIGMVIWLANISVVALVKDVKMMYASV